MSGYPQDEAAGRLGSIGMPCFIVSRKTTRDGGLRRRLARLRFSEVGDLARSVRSGICKIGPGGREQFLTASPSRSTRWIQRGLRCLNYSRVWACARKLPLEVKKCNFTSHQQAVKDANCKVVGRIPGRSSPGSRNRRYETPGKYRRTYHGSVALLRSMHKRRASSATFLVEGVEERPKS